MLGCFEFVLVVVVAVGGVQLLNAGCLSFAISSPSVASFLCMCEGKRERWTHR